MAKTETAKNGTFTPNQERNYIQVKGDTEEHYIKIYDSVNNDTTLSSNAFRIYAKIMQFLNMGKITDKKIYNSLNMNYRTYARYKKELIKSGYLDVCKTDAHNYEYYIKTNKMMLSTALDIDNLEKYSFETLKRFKNSRYSTNEEKQIIDAFFRKVSEIINTKWLDN